VESGERRVLKVLRKPRAGRKPAKKTTRVSLEAKAKPRQERAHSTYDAILEAAGELLAEVGVERLSTNLVCQRAGLTPPALYRYFPNKYALLKELGARLMAAQDEAVFAWQESNRDSRAGPVEVHAEVLRAIETSVNEITRQFPGGGWVMRALRAVPTLSEVRIASREAVAERDFETLRTLYPKADRKRLRIAATLVVEVMYAATELVMDQPELDAELITEEIAHMTALYLDSFRVPRKKIRLRDK
jgi:AcrR family transcriptional regulator